jgi:class 3 adenylate cyclase
MEIPLFTSAWLERTDGGRIPLVGNCALGRSSSNTVVIANERVSRHHATIHAQDAGDFWLIDMGSINGTLIGGRRVVQPQRLKDGDTIEIADTTLVFRQPLQESAPTSETTPATVHEVRTETRWLLLADIEGFTRLSQRLPAEELATLVGQWMRRCRETLELHGGSVNKYLGDGFLAWWRERAEAPPRVAEAVLALRAQRQAAEPKFRVVVHHGPVSIGGVGSNHGEENLLGLEVNFIFRVEKIAGSAGIPFCFTAAARGLLDGLLPFQPIPGRHELNGFSGRYEFFGL